jgi:hypothetical protein
LSGESLIVVEVLFTIDTEVWPDAAGWPHEPLQAGDTREREVAEYLWGTAASDFGGLPFQLATFARHGLKATYFVDPLFSYALGLPALRKVVDAIADHRQEVGLHLHPEWLTDPRCVGLPRFAGPLLSAYEEPEQDALIRAGAHRLAEAGARNVVAFRAGSWGANQATLRALKRQGFRFDSSLNACFAPSFSDLPARGALARPVEVGGVWEVPVTTFVDRPPSGRRPLHVCACSFLEFRKVLEHAEASAWPTVVIVLHSFEFVRVSRIARRGGLGRQRLLARRFESLCRYLADQGDRFRSVHFADLDPARWAALGPHEVARSHLGRTAARHVAQLLSRVY